MLNNEQVEGYKALATDRHPSHSSSVFVRNNAILSLIEDRNELKRFKDDVEKYLQGLPIEVIQSLVLLGIGEEWLIKGEDGKLRTYSNHVYNKAQLEVSTSFAQAVSSICSAFKKSEEDVKDGQSQNL
jgi:hypothetical protein